MRARRAAAREGDEFALGAATPPRSLAELIRLARGRTNVVELGTGAAWTAIALAIAEPGRRVITYDPLEEGRRELYLELAGPDAGARVELRKLPGEHGPEPGDPAPDFLFIDAAHDRESTVAAFRAWQESLAPGAVVAFHDYGYATWPGVAEAVEELGLGGEQVLDMFVWRRPG